MIFCASDSDLFGEEYNNHEKNHSKVKYQTDLFKFNLRKKFVNVKSVAKNPGKSEHDIIFLISYFGRSLDEKLNFNFNFMTQVKMKLYNELLNINLTYPLGLSVSLFETIIFGNRKNVLHTVVDVTTANNIFISYCKNNSIFGGDLEFSNKKLSFNTLALNLSTNNSNIILGGIYEGSFGFHSEFVYDNKQYNQELFHPNNILFYFLLEYLKSLKTSFILNCNPVYCNFSLENKVHKFLTYFDLRIILKPLYENLYELLVKGKHFPAPFMKLESKICFGFLLHINFDHISVNIIIYEDLTFEFYIQLHSHIIKKPLGKQLWELNRKYKYA